MSATIASTHSGAAAHEATEPATPPFFDTYSLMYAFGWLFLIPGLFALNTEPFRTYDVAYVTYITLPFLLGVLATFLTDSTDRGKTLLIRVAVLTPLTLICGMGVMWTLAFTTVPLADLLHPENYDATTPVAVALLVAIAAPLVWALWRRITVRPTWRSALQILALVIAIGSVIWLAYLMFQPHNTLRSIARKDIAIYITGALTWYLPSIAIAGGVWRKLGVV
jgi:hypothetical protein